MPAKVIVHSLPDYAHAQLITAAGRAFVADEPADQGGNDLGPDPYRLLLWALGACTAMTIQIYARRKKYPLLEVAVEVEHSRVHAEDCTDCEDQGAGRIEVFHRRIVLRGELSVEQREDLLRVASHCPVHKTLAAAPEVIDSVEVVA
ncbi:MAG: OsmC family protein [Tepidiformaceae bacterium]